MRLKSYLLNYLIFFASFNTAFLVCPTQLYLMILCASDVETLEITSRTEHAWNAGVGAAFYFIVLIWVLSVKFEVIEWCRNRRLRRISGNQSYELMGIVD